MLRFALGLAAFVVLQAAPIEKGARKVILRDGGSVEISNGGARRTFEPAFTILKADEDPQLSYDHVKAEAYQVPAWKARSGGKTMDLFGTIAHSEQVRAASATQSGQSIHWKFAAQSGDLDATLELPASGDPVLQFRFTPKTDGWYSIGYTGAPSVAVNQVEALWQPLIWQERRFPRLSFLSAERLCSLPVAIVTSAGATTAVAPDPAEVPFRIPSFTDSRFGVLLRNAKGEAQPAIFAPVLGSPPAGGQRLYETDERRYANTRPSFPPGPPSRMKAGQSFTFRIRLIVNPGGWYDTFRDVAQNLYGFHDYRQNTTGSLNDTLENMVSYAMNDVYSGWVADLRGFDYTTDVAGTVKVVSALHPLSVALIADSSDVFQRRALPIAEYLMSREKYLFSIAKGTQHQNPSYFMRGPAAEVSELAALYLMSGGRSSVFRHYADTLNAKPRALNLMMVSEGGSWQNELALFRMTGDRSHLDKARSGADRYVAERIDRLASDFSDVHIEQGGQFWTDFVPKWIDLFELYQETRDERYLRAAAMGARHYASLSWFAPPIPNADVTINHGDQVGIHGYMAGGVVWTGPMRAPEQKVPAWRVSQNGLVPEASTTFGGNPAVFLAHHAAYMLRVGEAVNDPFLTAVARSAIVGRYSNFPGYDINGEYTTIYERPDYPLRPLAELTYNNIYYNHVWPHIALLYDFLISDVETRSKGQISFPSRYAQGYAYLQSKVYGDRPGTFFGNSGVRLWMPAKLLHIDDPQINYVSGYDRNSLYIALSNQSAKAVTTTIRVNPDLVPFSLRDGYKVRTWQGGSASTPIQMTEGKVSVSLPASGLTAIAIDGIRIVPQFQGDVLSSASPLSEKSYSEANTAAGKVTGMLMSFGGRYSNAYIWMAATEDEVRSARLHYRFGSGEWKTIEDSRYPFEFSVPLGGSETFVYRVEAVPASGGAALDTAPVELRK